MNIDCESDSGAYLFLSSFYWISRKIPRNKHTILNFTSNTSSSSSSATTMNTIIFPSQSEHSSTDVLRVHTTNSSLNIQDLPPKSSSNVFPVGVSQSGQDPPAQPHLATYRTD
ncbi:unnamed protein product [Rotaria socialis]|uniref:Uncharacterized protein n=1 Tax=Rotaria socialis TaxID=392032 RepID=A0A819UDD2_9BILA|nr:unnamed protein product [Rotaria socialis]CAF4101352.1 unnamed protein product [Rotaria socialis]CAF4445835.1 unnamed protein product [Rotaria socialis]